MWLNVAQCGPMWLNRRLAILGVLRRSSPMWLNVAQHCATPSARGVGGRPWPEAREHQAPTTQVPSEQRLTHPNAPDSNDPPPRVFVLLLWTSVLCALASFRTSGFGFRISPVQCSATRPGVPSTSPLHPMTESRTERLSFRGLGGRSLSLCVWHYKRYDSAACRTKKALKSLSASFVRAFTPPRPTSPTSRSDTRLAYRPPGPASRRACSPAFRRSLAARGATRDGQDRLKAGLRTRPSPPLTACATHLLADTPRPFPPSTLSRGTFHLDNPNRLPRRRKPLPGREITSSGAPNAESRNADPELRSRGGGSRVTGQRKMWLSGLSCGHPQESPESQKCRMTT